MAAFKKDLTIPKELLNLFKNSARIVEKKKLAGFWPPDLQILKELEKSLPELFANEAIMKKYDVAVTYTGRAMKNDLKKMGLLFNEERIVKDFFVHGIPVPWQLLKKAGINHQKIGVILVPKEMNH